MSTNDSNRTDDLIAAVVNAFERVHTPPRPTDAETIGALFPYSEPGGRLRFPFHRRRIMRVVAPLAALAASIVLVATWWPSSHNVVFAQVIEQIKKADAVAFTITLHRPGFPKVSGNVYAKSPDLLRYDLESNGHTAVNITNYAKGELITFDPTSNEAHIWKIQQEPGVDVLRQLRQMEAHLAKRVDSDAESDPNTDVFQLQEGDATGKVWVDKQTKLPTRIEMDSPPESGLGGVVYDNFDWNATIADSMFEIPTGFTVTTNNLLAEPTEEELVAAFRIRQAFSDTPYPADFLTSQAGLTIGRLAYDSSLSREENHQLRLKVLRPVLSQIGITEIDAQDAKKLGLRIDYLCMKLDQWATLITGDGAWIGGGVRPGEDKPLCWWRKPKAEHVRVLYADLTIRDADQPPPSK
jgi:outer membrane lipoprotein-sorting protein